MGASKNRSRVARRRKCAASRWGWRSRFARRRRVPRRRAARSACRRRGRPRRGRGSPPCRSRSRHWRTNRPRRRAASTACPCSRSDRPRTARQGAAPGGRGRPYRGAAVRTLISPGAGAGSGPGGAGRRQKALAAAVRGAARAALRARARGRSKGCRRGPRWRAGRSPGCSCARADGRPGPTRGQIVAHESESVSDLAEVSRRSLRAAAKDGLRGEPFSLFEAILAVDTVVTRIGAGQRLAARLPVRLPAGLPGRAAGRFAVCFPARASGAAAFEARLTQDGVCRSRWRVRRSGRRSRREAPRAARRPPGDRQGCPCRPSA